MASRYSIFKASLLGSCWSDDKYSCSSASHCGQSMSLSNSGKRPLIACRSFMHPLEAPSCLVGALTMCPPPPINLWQHSTLHPHLHTHSEPGCTATFGCAHPSMFPIAWRNFHHKPALVAPFILWLEYLLCAHHTHFPIFQLLGTHVDPLFCQPGPFTACTPPRTPFCAPLHTPAHLRTPLHTFVLHLSWACHPYLTFL